MKDVFATARKYGSAQTKTPIGYVTVMYGEHDKLYTLVAKQDNRNLLIRGTFKRAVKTLTELK